MNENVSWNQFVKQAIQLFISNEYKQVIPVIVTYCRIIYKDWIMFKWRKHCLDQKGHQVNKTHSWIHTKEKNQIGNLKNDIFLDHRRQSFF